MALVFEQPTSTFDLKQIKRGYLFWGKHCTWNQGEAGFVTSATEKLLIIQYHPRIGNVTNHFRVPISEVVDGQWGIRWSADMSEVFEYGIKKEDNQETEGGEGEDESRGTDP